MIEVKHSKTNDYLKGRRAGNSSVQHPETHALLPASLTQEAYEENFPSTLHLLCHNIKFDSNEITFHALPIDKHVLSLIWTFCLNELPALGLLLKNNAIS